MSSFTIYPKIDQDEAISILEELGVYGAVRTANGRLRLDKKMRKRIDPGSGQVVLFSPEEQITPEIRTKLEGKGWLVVHSSANRWIPLFTK